MFGNRYDIILDCANRGPEHVRLKGYPHSTYIALNAPFLKNTDQHGLIVGMAKNVQNLLRFNIPTAENKSCVKWGFFIPSQTGINVLQKLVENKEVCIIQKFVKCNLYSANNITSLDILFCIFTDCTCCSTCISLSRFATGIRESESRPFKR